MFVLANLMEEVRRNASAQAAMDMMETTLARRTREEQGAFWHAVSLYYMTRKHPGQDAPAIAVPEIAALEAGVSARA